MTQTKEQHKDPMAVWWKTLERSQQMMQDNTRKLISQMIDNQKKMVDMCFDIKSSKSED